MNSILYIFLPCKKVYPIGVTYLADFIHRRKPEVRQRIVDLSLFPESQRTQAIRDAAPKDANYLDLVNQHVASSDPSKPAPNPEAAAPGNPTAEDMAAAQGMSSGDRQQMIMGMVATLDARLKNEPDNFEGWMRLVRSYAMLDMKDKAADALARALKQFPADTDKGRQLSELASSLGISAEGGNP